MTDLSKQIQNLTKQNNGMYESLKSKGIDFERINIDSNDSDESKLEKLKLENDKLKELSKANRPVQTKEPKEKIQIIQTTKTKPKETEENIEDDEPSYEDKKKKFNMIQNMESLKINFFSGNYELFRNETKSHPFLFYKGNYKYNSDKDGVPSFNAKNLVKGLVKSFEEEKKLFMICFRCFQTDTNPSKYEYKSWMIVNTTDPLNEVVGSTIDDFELEQIPNDMQNDKLDNFLIEMEKLPLDENEERINNCIEESYVH